MKVKAFVLEDSGVKDYSFTGQDGKAVAGQSRSLVCVDLDEGDRIESSFRVKIPLETADPNLRDKMVELSIKRIEQDAKTKQLGFRGLVVKVSNQKVA